MEGVNRVESSQVDTPQMQQLTTLVDWRLKPTLLTGEHPLEFSFGHTERWAYYADGRPVGLLLISVNPPRQSATVEWLFVEASYRNRGIASLLFASALESLKQLKIQALFLYFPKNGEFSPAIEGLLQKFHWAPSTPFVQKYRFNVVEFNPPWFKKEHPLPSGYSFFPWNTLTPREEAALEHRFDQYQIAPALTPFRLPHLIDPCSVGIRSKDGVVGWSVCHWYDADNLEFSSLYVEPELARLGLGVSVLAQSIRLLKEHPRRNAWMVIRQQDDPIPSWTNFIKKRLAGYTEEILDIHQTYLIIGS